MSLLELRDLTVGFPSEGGEVSALSGVTLSLRRGETLGLVGESGCGKSTLAGAVMGLLPENARIDGEIRFEDRDLRTLAEDERRSLRGGRIAMIFQDPLSALDPAFSVGDQIAEALRAHQSIPRRTARGRAIELLGEVGVVPAAERYGEPPHRFSGGMRQRVVIAAALANDPELLIADEPTTALDATIQAQVLALLADLRARHGMTTLLISHNLGIVAQTCDRVGVLYAGQLVELAPTRELFAAPRHPYTQALIAALPGMDELRASLNRLGGRVPDLAAPPPGCRLAPRCPHAMPECAERPVLAGAGEHTVACWLDDTSRTATRAAAPVARAVSE